MASPATLYYTQLEIPVCCLYVAYIGEIPQLISAERENIFTSHVRKHFGILPIRNDGARIQMLNRILATILGVSPYPGLLSLSCLTVFQREVLVQTTHIPRGEVRSYAWLAQKLGRPRAWRAVGTALARNPLPFIIPCHRVIRSNGHIGAYSGGGDKIKERMLAFEGADLSQLYGISHENHMHLRSHPVQLRSIVS